jgi:hypothetical protein
MLAQLGGYFRWPDLLERLAANGIDDLDAAFAGGRDDAFAGDPDDLFGVGKADIPCGGEDLQGTCLDAQDFFISKLMASGSPSLMRPGPPLTVGIL